VPARVNFLRESGTAAADNYTSCVAFLHGPGRIQYSCVIFFTPTLAGCAAKMRAVPR
jgi:hypothetical protein